MYKLFLVEDDKGIADGIVTLASTWGYEVVCCADFRAVTDEFIACAPHLVLLDIGLPFAGGFHWCREIRKLSSVPIIFLSSASDNLNMVMAMNEGADDFIPKPFDGNVLMAKVQALLRRSYDFAPSSPLLSHKGAIFNVGDGSLTFEGEKIELSKNESRILFCLLTNKGKTVSREKLMTELWATDSFVDENTLTVNVNRLRKKLAAAGLSEYIVTKFGEGYRVE